MREMNMKNKKKSKTKNKELNKVVSIAKE